jgi:hypothetical protein
MINDIYLPLCDFTLCVSGDFCVKIRLLSRLLYHNRTME